MIKKLLSHFRSNWIQYGFETIVVVAGIIIAFALNSWYESAKERKIEIKILKELRSDLRANYHEISDIRDLAQRSYNDVDSVFLSIEQNLAFKQYWFDFLRRPRIGLFNNAASAYKLIESGGMNVLSNDSIRILVTHMYEYDFENIKTRENLLWEFYNNEVIPYRLTHFRHISDRNSYDLVPKDEQKLRQDEMFCNILQTLRSEIDIRIRLREGALDDLNLLIGKISIEIQKLGGDTLPR